MKRRHHASVVLDGKIYAMGGCGHLTSSPVDTVEVYDPQADSWQRVASMPQRRHSHAAAVMGGKIYVTGGYGDSQTSSVNSAYVYDPQADAWTQLANMAIARKSHASAAVGGKLYVFGGCGGVLLTTVEIYHPDSDSWADGLSLTSLVAITLSSWWRSPRGRSLAHNSMVAVAL